MRHLTAILLLLHYESGLVDVPVNMHGQQSYVFYSEYVSFLIARYTETLVVLTVASFRRL